MPAKLAEADQMTVEEFLAFLDARPDGGRWELIEGVAFMSPSPTDWHQFIVTNIVTWLANHKHATDAAWFPLVGVGTVVPVSPNSLPQPDVLVKANPGQGRHVTDDALVVFEILSKSNTRADQAWRKRMYTSVANCEHYVTVETTRAEVTRYDRSTSWTAVTTTGLDNTLKLAALGAECDLRNIYRWTPIT